MPRDKDGMSGASESSSFSILHLPPAAGFEQHSGIQIPLAFIHSFSKPHWTLSLRYHVWPCGPCPGSTLSLTDDNFRASWTHREILCLSKSGQSSHRGIRAGSGDGVVVNGLGYLGRKQTCSLVTHWMTWTLPSFVTSAVERLATPFSSLPCRWRELEEAVLASEREAA